MIDNVLLSSKTSKNSNELLFIGTLKLTILRGESKTLATCNTEPFYSNSYLLEAVNYCSEYPDNLAGALEPPLKTLYYLMILKQYLLL